MMQNIEPILVKLLEKNNHAKKSDKEIKREIVRLRNRMDNFAIEPESQDIIKEFHGLCDKFSLNGFDKASIYLKSLLSMYIDWTERLSIPIKQASFIILLLMRLSVSPLRFGDLRVDLNKLTFFYNQFPVEKIEFIDLGTENIQENFVFIDQTENSIDITNLDSTIAVDEESIHQIPEESEFGLKRLFVPIVANYWYRRFSNSPLKDSFLITEHELLRESIWLLMGLKNSCFLYNGQKYQLSNGTHLIDIPYTCSNNYVHKISLTATKIKKIITFIDSHTNTKHDLFKFYRRLLNEFLHEWNNLLSKLEDLIRIKKIKSIFALTNSIKFSFSTIDLLYEIIIIAKESETIDDLLELFYEKLANEAYDSNSLCSRFIAWCFLNTFKLYFELLCEHIFSKTPLESLNIKLDKSFQNKILTDLTAFKNKIIKFSKIYNIFSQLISLDSFEVSERTSLFKDMIERYSIGWKSLLDNKINKISSGSLFGISSDKNETSFIDTWNILIDIKNLMDYYAESCSIKINEYFLNYMQVNIDFNAYLYMIQAVFCVGCSSEVLEFKELCESKEFSNIRLTNTLQGLIRTSFEKTDIIQIKRPKLGTLSYGISFIRPFPIDNIIQKSHIKQLNLIHEKIISILSVLENIKKLELCGKSQKFYSKKSFQFVNLVKWKLLSFFTTVYGNIQDTINLIILPLFKNSIKNAKSYYDYIKEMDHLINDLSIATYINKESLCVCKTLNLIIQFGQDFVNVWKEKQQSGTTELREIYLRVNERIDLLKDQLILIGKILKNENYYNLSKCI